MRFIIDLINLIDLKKPQLLIGVCPKTRRFSLKCTIYCGQGPQLTNIWLGAVPDSAFSDGH